MIEPGSLAFAASLLVGELAIVLCAAIGFNNIRKRFGPDRRLDWMMYLGVPAVMVLYAVALVWFGSP